MPRSLQVMIVGFFLLLTSMSVTWAQTVFVEELAKLKPNILVEHSPESLGQMLGEYTLNRIQQVNHRSSREWHAIAGEEQWADYARKHIQALRNSLGDYPEASDPPKVHVSNTLAGDGFRIENLVFESRPRLWVTANLYVPDPVRSSMPGIIISHSHHNPKEQGELQDMGMTWARLGCLVLIMDLVGHGERNDHPFESDGDYAGEFRLGRQDYYFRYNLGIQLYLIGDSLMGWIVQDMRRAVDLLLSRDGVDPTRIILMGSVAGGGDPAAVTSALDQRIAAAIPFNFGGPEPESPYPLPNDAEASFNYATSGSWESTRNLRLSCRDGFLPWVVVAGIAPRRLVYAHEFSWDRDRDPVWKRLQRVYGEFHGVPEHLAFTHGFGLLTESPPKASHCNNIGAFHRKGIHDALQRWFQIEGTPEKELSERRPREELICLTEELIRKLQPLSVHEKAAEVGRSRWMKTRQQLESLDPAERRQRLRTLWRELLGDVDPPIDPHVMVKPHREELPGGLWVEKAALEVEPGLLVPLLTLGTSVGRGLMPIVVCVAQEGKIGFLQKRTRELAGLLAGGVAVCLVDVRGTGETAVPGGRGRSSRSTSISATEQMLGQTLVGSRLKDLRSVLKYLKQRPGLDPKSIGVYGDSFAASNLTDADLKVPLGVEATPAQAEPLGGLLSMLLALFEDEIDVVYASGGLSCYLSILSSPFCYVPHDAVVPGAIGAGDLQLLAAALAPRSVLLEGLVDGQNRRVEESTLKNVYAPTFDAFRSHPQQFTLNQEVSLSQARVAWFLDALN